MSLRRSEKAMNLKATVILAELKSGAAANFFCAQEIAEGIKLCA
jgi:hypothetical protein